MEVDWTSRTAAAVTEKPAEYNFALVPKSNCIRFFESIYEGCQDEAMARISRCHCIEGSGFPPTFSQADIVANITRSGRYDGIAIAVTNTEEIIPVISDAIDAGIPVITYDSDAADSRRHSYIGTSNIAMGRELAKVLKQIRPHGGSFVLLSGTGPNILDRERGVRNALKGSTWVELDDGAATINSTLPELGGYVDQMFDLVESLRAKGADARFHAFVALLGTPMNRHAEQWIEFSTMYPNITLVSTDWSDNQMDMLGKGYVDGLVGQLPYEMGRQSAAALHKLVRNETVESTILGTNQIEILRVPLILPKHEVDYNYLGSIVILGYVAFALVAILAIWFSTWVYMNRKCRVVRASQPPFMYLLCFGVIVFASAIIPLGIDDEHHNIEGCSMACMAVPWLTSLGFVLIFPVLFSKTWRVNKIMNNPDRFRRIKVTVKDVILPLIILMAANIIVLSLWTGLNPIRYVRGYGLATDLWNRPTDSAGMCRSQSEKGGLGALPFAIPLCLIDFGALVLANIQAYKARDLETEFSESRSIAWVLVSILQASIIGIPVIILSRQQNDPTVSYIVSTLLVFVLSLAILLLIFTPKFMYHREWKTKQAEKEKKKAEQVQQASLNDGTESIGHTSRTDEGTSGLRFDIKVSSRKLLVETHVEEPPPDDEMPQ